MALIFTMVSSLDSHWFLVAEQNNIW